MDNLIHYFMHWVSTHPHLTGLAVGIVACSESLAFIGLLVPGTPLMLAAGALVGAGLVNFWAIFTWAVAGAILGDGVSYWVGHHYRDHLREIKILRRHPLWFNTATDFFHHHGGKSILLARFVGPVRPVIPVVAGMLGMTPTRFYLNNILSALVWAPIHLLIGMVVGASLVLAGQVATRLAIVLSVLVLSTWLVIWLVHRAYLRLHAGLSDQADHILRWCRTHPKFAWLFNDIYDPARPPIRVLLIWLGLLIASTWLFLAVLAELLTHDPLINAGRGIFHFLQQLHTPLTDTVMVAVTELGDAAVTMPVAMTVLFWLLLRKAWRDAFYWLSALCFGIIGIIVIKLMSHIPKSQHIDTTIYGFSSGHATMSTVIYGLLAVFIASTLRNTWRWAVYAIATLLIVAISFSRLYLGAYWLADVTAGVALGTAGVAVLAITYEQHSAIKKTDYGLPVVAVIAFLAAAVWHIHSHFDSDRIRYSTPQAATRLTTQQWWQQDWQQLPVWRHDLRGIRAQPLNVQWAGELATIKKQLLARGWHIPLFLNAKTALSWLLPHPSIKQLPVLPELHDGQYEALALISSNINADTHEEEFIIRLWPTSIRINSAGTPLWLGTVTTQKLHHLPLISFPRLTQNYDQALTRLQHDLSGLLEQSRQRILPPKQNHHHWDGKVLLINGTP